MSSKGDIMEEMNNTEDVKKETTRKRRGRPRKKVEEVKKETEKVVTKPKAEKQPESLKIVESDTSNIETKRVEEVKKPVSDEESAEFAKVSPEVTPVVPCKVTGTYMVRNKPIESSPVKKISGNFIIDGVYNSDFYEVRYVKYSFGAIRGYIKKSDIQ